MDNDISVIGQLGGMDELATDQNEEAGQENLSENTVTLKPSNSHLPQTSSHETLSLPFVGFIICATIIIGYGINIITHKKRSDSVRF